MPPFEHRQCNVLEILRPNPAPGRLRFAVFDFDGTLSLLRGGGRGDGRSDGGSPPGNAASGAGSSAPAQTAEPVFGMGAGRPHTDAVAGRRGKATRWQAPDRCEAYKHQYLVRLSERIRHRADLEAGRQPPERFRVPGRWSSWPHFMHAAWPVPSPPAPTRALFEEVALLGFGAVDRRPAAVPGGWF